MTKRIVAVTGEYTNQQGEQKAEFTNVGIIGVSNNGKEYVLLDPLYSAAGVLAKQNALAMKRNEPVKDMVMCSVFENDNNNGQQQGGYQQPQQNNQQPQQQGNWGQPQQPNYNNNRG